MAAETSPDLEGGSRSRLLVEFLGASACLDCGTFGIVCLPECDESVRSELQSKIANCLSRGTCPHLLYVLFLMYSGTPSTHL